MYRSFVLTDVFDFLLENVVAFQWQCRSSQTQNSKECQDVCTIAGSLCSTVSRLKLISTHFCFVTVLVEYLNLTTWWCSSAGASSCLSICHMLASSMNGGNLAWLHTLQSTESWLVNMDAKEYLLPLSQTDFNLHSAHPFRFDCFPFACDWQVLLLVMVNLQLPATSQTPPTVCSGGTLPSLTCLRSAMVNKLLLFLLHSGLFVPATPPPPPPPGAMCWCHNVNNHS